MESILVFGMVVVISAASVVGIHIYMSNQNAINARRERELNYREELRNMRMNAGLPPTRPGDDGGILGDLAPVVQLLQDPSIQGILKTVLTQQSQSAQGFDGNKEN